jgi:hypothetical protein
MGLNGVPVTLEPGVFVRGRHGEKLRVKELVESFPYGKKREFWQLERLVPESGPGADPHGFHEKYPEAAHWLDSWIDPELRDARMHVGGVDLPDFNRFSLHDFWGEISPFGPLAEVEGYTPDVFLSKSLVGTLTSKVRDLLNRTWTAPGREYKSGEARERGQIRDLFAGFNVRAAEAHMETQRKALAEGLLGKALKQVPDTGVLPPGYVSWKGETIDHLLRAHYMALGLDPAHYKVFKNDELFDVNERQRLERLAGGLAAQAAKTGDMMIHQSALNELRRPLASSYLNNRLLRMLDAGIKGAVGGYLTNPFTLATNQLSNELFITMHTARKALEGLFSLGSDNRQAKQSLYEAGNLLKGVLTDRWYNPKVRELVPDEMFDGNHRFSTIATTEFEKSPLDLLRELNFSGAILKAMRYGNVDVRAKQRIAFASYLAHARLAWDDAQAAGKVASGRTRRSG